MNILQKSAAILAQACKGSPITSTIVVILFFFAFNFLEAAIEKIYIGKPFAHVLDPIFVACFIAYAAYAVYYCAVYNSSIR